MKSAHSLLVVDDDLELSSLLTQSLAATGYNVVQSSTVGDARLKLSNQAFSCIILDVHLANKSGVDIAIQLRKNHSSINFKTPILIVSGLLSPEIIQQAAPLVQGILSKPFLPEELLEKVAQLINGVQTSTDAPMKNDRLSKEFRVFLHDFSSKIMILNLITKQLKDSLSQKKLKPETELTLKLEENLSKIKDLIEVVRFSIKSESE